MLRKTTILPTDDAVLACGMLRQLINEEPHVLMIVLGDDDEADLCTERADKMSGAPTEPRWVAWARDRAAVQEVLDELKGTRTLRDKLPKAIAVALSLSDVVRDVVPGPKAPDLFRIYQAYKKAEGNQGA